MYIYPIDANLGTRVFAFVPLLDTTFSCSPHCGC